MRLSELYRAAKHHTSWALMWHGTTTKFLRSIKKQGFVPTPKNKVWADDPDSQHSPQRTRASLKGTYFTTNFMTAVSSAGNAKRKFGGDYLIVAARIQPRSGAADEDSIRYHLERVFDDLVGRPSRWWGLRAHDSKQWDDNLKHLIRSVHNKLATGREPVPTQALIDYANAELDYAVAKESKTRRELDMRRDVWDGIQQALEKQGLDYEELRTREKAFWDGPVVWPTDIGKAEQEYLKAIDKLTKHYRKSGTRDKGFGGFNVRIEEPVDFRGRNRILCMFSWDPDARQLKLEYGHMDSKTKTAFEQYWGGEYEVVK